MQKKEKAAASVPAPATAKSQKPTQGFDSVSVSILPDNVRFVTAEEAMKILCCSRNVANRCIHEVNERLRAAGCFTMQGRCNRQAFYKYIGY